MKISIILSLSFLVSSAFASEQKYSEYIQLERDKNFTTPGIVRSCDGKIGLLDYLWVSRYSGVHLRYEGTGWPWKDILGSLLNDLEAVDSIQGGLVKDIANDLSANFRIEEGIASEVLQVGRCKFLKVFQKTTQGRDAIFIDKTIWENLSDHDRAGFFLGIALSRQKAKQFEGVKWGAGHNPNRVRFLNLLVASQLLVDKKSYLEISKSAGFFGEVGHSAEKEGVLRCTFGMSIDEFLAESIPGQEESFFSGGGMISLSLPRIAHPVPFINFCVVSDALWNNKMERWKTQIYPNSVYRRIFSKGHLSWKRGEKAVLVGRHMIDRNRIRVAYFEHSFYDNGQLDSAWVIKDDSHLGSRHVKEESFALDFTVLGKELSSSGLFHFDQDGNVRRVQNLGARIDKYGDITGVYEELIQLPNGAVSFVSNIKFYDGTDVPEIIYSKAQNLENAPLRKHHFKIGLRDYSVVLGTGKAALLLNPYARVSSACVVGDGQKFKSKIGKWVKLRRDRLYRLEFDDFGEVWSVEQNCG